MLGTFLDFEIFLVIELKNRNLFDGSVSEFSRQKVWDRWINAVKKTLVTEDFVYRRAVLQSLRKLA